MVRAWSAIAFCIGLALGIFLGRLALADCDRAAVTDDELRRWLLEEEALGE